MKCRDFIEQVLHTEPTLPLTFQQIQLYVAYLHTMNYKSSTIAAHLSAISHMHKIHHLSDPTSGYAISKMLIGIRNIQGAGHDQRQPITRPILKGLLAALPSCAPTLQDIHLYKSMFTLMYYACLRASEVLQTDTPEHNLHISDINFHSADTSYIINFHSYKHSAQADAKINVITIHDTDCPVTSLRQYLAQRGHQPGPIYLRNGHTVTRSQFLYVLRSCLTYINLSNKNFNIHSFRIGRTTDMAEQNVPHSMIQKIGRWKSTAFLKYIRPQDVTTQP